MMTNDDILKISTGSRQQKSTPEEIISVLFDKDNINVVVNVFSDNYDYIIYSDQRKNPSC